MAGLHPPFLSGRCPQTASVAGFRGFFDSSDSLRMTGIGVVGSATEHQEPPYALIGHHGTPISTTCSNNAKNGTLRCPLECAVFQARRRLKGGRADPASTIKKAPAQMSGGVGFSDYSNQLRAILLDCGIEPREQDIDESCHAKDRDRNAMSELRKQVTPEHPALLQSRTPIRMADHTPRTDQRLASGADSRGSPGWLSATG